MLAQETQAIDRGITAGDAEELLLLHSLQQDPMVLLQRPKSRAHQLPKRQQVWRTGTGTGNRWCCS